MESEEKEDNLTKQIDEIEVLMSIYGEDWHVENEAKRQYYIDVRSDEETDGLQLRVTLTLPDEYPSGSPPIYDLAGHWLRGESRMEIETDLRQIYLENAGDCILYLWIEKVREFLRDLREQQGIGKSFGEQLLAAWTEPDQSEGAEGYVAEAWEPTAADFIQKKSIENIPCPEIHHSEFVIDRKSKFQSHLAAVSSKEEIEVVRNKLLENRKIEAATHNIIAYRIRVPNSDIMFQNCEDDGEFGAGGRMLHLLNILNAENVMVVVTRWYGGIHLGPDRFKHINNLAREILQQHGYIKEKEEKKGPRTSKKK